MVGLGSFSVVEHMKVLKANTSREGMGVLFPLPYASFPFDYS